MRPLLVDPHAVMGLGFDEPDYDGSPPRPAAERSPGAGSAGGSRRAAGASRSRSAQDLKTSTSAATNLGSTLISPCPRPRILQHGGFRAWACLTPPATRIGSSHPAQARGDPPTMHRRCSGRDRATTWPSRESARGESSLEGTAGWNGSRAVPIVGGLSVAQLEFRNGLSSLRFSTALPGSNPGGPTTRRALVDVSRTYGHHEILGRRREGAREGAEADDRFPVRALVPASASSR